ncbi:antibiotic biosynthesis monooxygenase family protein [Lampropedia aestuarii]|uniref:antibiotic biosynthesis monooxygenase family protein n=1 Tax=Lampropedia aestuarii TaxID=2562762 RepID=UPI00197CE06A|nr:hypothetical protein [Lampropedia aestuarii]
MYVVIFRAKVRILDEEYSKVANRMRELALTEFGCLDFHAVTEGNQEVALSYWPNEESIRAWKLHSEHLLAQRTGQKNGMNHIQFNWLKLHATIKIDQPN